jgi:hypothetical protein
MDLAWKPNWAETRRHFTDWWQRRGLVVGSWGGVRAAQPQADLPRPEHISPASEAFYSDARTRAARDHYMLSRQDFPLDMIPSADTMIGPGSLALCLGSEPAFSENTVWFGPTMEQDENPEQRAPLRFDPENRWWKVHEATLRACSELAHGRYLVGCPDLVENIDILASLRDMTPLFMDMIERPEWVSETLREINAVYFEVYDRIYEIICGPDGGSVFEAYKLWGPGKTAKVQCDAATMFSPQMFREFVAPRLREQCAFLDYSMYHLDGQEQFRHLDTLLEIEELDAIEWTPNANLPLGGDPQWFDLYRRILDAGKSVQVYLVWAEEIVPVLDAIGSEGVYILGLFRSPDEVESVARGIEGFR